MSSLLAVEILTSLAVQAALFLAVCGWLSRRTTDEVARDRLWTTAHVLLLLLAVADFALPHQRWLVAAAYIPEASYPAVLTAADWTARVLVAIWLAGVAGYVALIGLSLCRGFLLVRNSRPLLEADPAALRELNAELNPAGTTGVEIRISANVGSPFLWQFHRPTIVLPEFLLQFPVDELRVIVAHELAHFECRHPLHLFLQRLVEMTFWYHPAVWRASRRAAAARELRCDAASVDSAEQAACFLRSLIRLMERRVAPRALPAGLNFLGDGRFVQQRTAELLRRFEPKSAEQPPAGKRLTFATTIAALILAGVFWLPLNPSASRRSWWSPWPSWSARTLHEVGMPVRDYEVDGHRLTPHVHGE